MSVFTVLWNYTDEENLQLKRQRTEELYTLLITVTAYFISRESTSALITALHMLFGVSCTAEIISHINHDPEFFALVVKGLENELGHGTERDSAEAVGER